MSIILDIETCSKSEQELSDIMPEFEANKTYKDPLKIAADLESKKQEWLQDGALHAERGRVLAVGVLNTVGGKPVIIEGSEPVIIGEVWSMFNSTHENIIGHCIKTFDIPFLLRRSWINGIAPPSGVMSGRYPNSRFRDTMETWQCGTREMISLDNLSKAFGLPGKAGLGKDFAPQYLDGGESKERAIKYLFSDLELTYLVASKMGVL